MPRFRHAFLRAILFSLIILILGHYYAIAGLLLGRFVIAAFGFMMTHFHERHWTCRLYTPPPFHNIPSFFTCHAEWGLLSWCHDAALLRCRHPPYHLFFFCLSITHLFFAGAIIALRVASRADDMRAQKRAAICSTYLPITSFRRRYHYFACRFIYRHTHMRCWGREQAQRCALSAQESFSFILRCRQFRHAMPRRRHVITPTPFMPLLPPAYFDITSLLNDAITQTYTARRFDTISHYCHFTPPPLFSLMPRY